MKAINVLEVIRQGQIGGGESHLLDLIAGFDSTIHTTVLSFTDGQMIDTLKKQGIKCYVIPTSSPFDIRVYKKIRSLIIKENIQIIHTHGSRAASNVAFVAKRMHIPLIYTVHGWSFHQDQPKLIKAVRAFSEKILCKLSQETICVSESNRKTGEEVFGLKNARVIENGINLKKFNPNNNFTNIRKEFNFSDNDFIIGFIGRVTLQKAPIDFIESISIANKKDSRIKAIFVGEGDMLDKSKEAMKEHNLEDIIQIHPFRNDIPDVLHSIDVFCLPSLWEGLSIALIEAMAMKKAIVATPTDGTKEVIVHNANGLICSFNNPEELAKHYVTYLHNPHFTATAGNNAYKVVEERFNSQRVADKVMEIYHKLI